MLFVKKYDTASVLYIFFFNDVIFTWIIHDELYKCIMRILHKRFLTNLEKCSHCCKCALLAAIFNVGNVVNV